MDSFITKLYDNTWSIADDGVRIFLLAGTARAMVIDTGMTGLEVRTQGRFFFPISS